jgi:hypothetical protein
LEFVDIETLHHPLNQATRSGNSKRIRAPAMNVQAPEDGSPIGELNIHKKFNNVVVIG